jgi:PadR family transcriptional regulator, regulatory protein AphA
MKEKRSKYAILGILSMGPMSGYDIKKMFEKSIGNFWSESYGQIYPLLKVLVGEGFATSSTQKQVGKPDRHVYSLTDAGRAELCRWLAEPVKDHIGRIEIALKLFFGHQVSTADSIRQVERFKTMRNQEIRALRATEERLKTEQTNNPNLPYMLATVSYGQHVTQALLHWCDETLRVLNKLSEAETESGRGVITNRDHGKLRSDASLKSPPEEGSV